MNVLGVLSGTSVDAIDLALAGLELAGHTLVLEPRGHIELPWPDDVRAALLALGTTPGGRGLGGRGLGGDGGAQDWCRLHADVGRALGAASARALAELGPAHLVACHGQTVHHLVEDGLVRGTLQIGDPAYVHAATGLPVVADLRSADVAAGGQGAPLASTLDALWLGTTPTAVLNLGGIANVTLVGTPDGVLAGDTGPANCLLDAAAAESGLRCDIDGALAAAGRVDEAALRRLLADPYYARPLPKSTGRDHFHTGYVAEILGAAAPTGPDLFATLTELTARTVADALTAGALTAGALTAGALTAGALTAGALTAGALTAGALGADGPGGTAREHVRVERIVGSGGGVRNPVLLTRIRDITGLPVLTSDELGMPAAAKEAYLMALLGWLSVHGLPGVVTGRRGPVTGARHAAVLGSLTPPYVTGGLAAALHEPRPYAAPTRLVLAGPHGGDPA